MPDCCSCSIYTSFNPKLFNPETLHAAAVSDKQHPCVETMLSRRNPLRYGGLRYNQAAMKRLFDMDDRASLRERFFGAPHSVLAHLSGAQPA
jgi:hypothetical protein